MLCFILMMNYASDLIGNVISRLPIERYERFSEHVAKFTKHLNNLAGVSIAYPSCLKNNKWKIEGIHTHLKVWRDLESFYTLPRPSAETAIMRVLNNGSNFPVCFKTFFLKNNEMQNTFCHLIRNSIMKIFLLQISYFILRKLKNYF